jgi:hypothetical protein
MAPAAAVMEMISPADVQASAEAAQKEALTFVDVNKVAVTDVVSLERAVLVRTAIGEKMKAIQETLAPPKSWAYKLHRWFCDLESAATAPYEHLDTYERAQISDFKQAQDRIREARERELADERRRADEARAAAEAAALERSGEHEMAAAVMEEAIAAPQPVVALPDVTRGVASFTRRWTWRYAGGPKDVKQTPPQILARTMALIPREFLCVDEAKIGTYARSMKGSGKIPGIEIYYVDDPRR